MEMQQIIEMLAKAEANRKADMEKMDASMKTHQEEMRANQVRADADRVHMQ
jgi:formate-dependent nitrite reductase cytochrome c552 subunit